MVDQTSVVILLELEQDLSSSGKVLDPEIVYLRLIINKQIYLCRFQNRYVVVLSVIDNRLTLTYICVKICVDLVRIAI